MRLNDYQFPPARGTSRETTEQVFIKLQKRYPKCIEQLNDLMINHRDDSQLLNNAAGRYIGATAFECITDADTGTETYSTGTQFVNMFSRAFDTNKSEGEKLFIYTDIKLCVMYKVLQIARNSDMGSDSQKAASDMYTWMQNQINSDEQYPILQEFLEKHPLIAKQLGYKPTRVLSTV